MKRLFEKFRKFKDISKKLQSFEPYETDENGHRVIRIHVHDDDYFLSQLAPEGVPVIDDDTAYLLNFYLKTLSYRDDSHVKIIITGNCITESDHNIYRKAIANYYKEEFIEVEEKLQENRKKAFTMAFSGVLMIVLAILFRQIIGDIVFELFDIAGWVFIWEVLDIVFMRSPELRKTEIRNMQMLEAEIIFQ